MSARVPDDDRPRYAPLAQAAEYAGVPPSTLRDWIRRGEIRGYRMGPRLIQVDLDDVDALRRPIPAARPGRAVARRKGR